MTTPQKTFELTTKQLSSVLDKLSLDTTTISSVMEQWSDNTNRKTFVRALSKQVEKNPSDPNAPKRARSAYIFFCQQERENVKNSPNGPLDANQVLKELGARWKKLTDAQKVPFIKMAEEDRVRYTTDKSAYVPPSREQLVASALSRRRRDPNGPRNPRTSYMFFCENMRPQIAVEHPELKSPQIVKEMGARWRALTDAQKAHWNELATQDRLRYETEKQNGVTRENSTHVSPAEVSVPVQSAPATKSRKSKSAVSEQTAETSTEVAPTKSSRRSKATTEESSQSQSVETTEAPRQRKKKAHTESSLAPVPESSSAVVEEAPRKRKTKAH